MTRKEKHHHVSRKEKHHKKREERNSAIRELLSDYREVGARVVLFLESFHVEGAVGHIGKTFVTLHRGNGEGVEVESNSNGNSLENPNRIRVKISQIKAVSDDQGP